MFADDNFPLASGMDLERLISDFEAKLTRISNKENRTRTVIAFTNTVHEHATNHPQ